MLVSPAVSAFPDRVVGSACASAFSRFARRSLTLRPAHSRCHQFVTRFTRRLQPFRFLRDCSGCFRLEHFAGRGLHPLESAAFSRRTPTAAIGSNPSIFPVDRLPIFDASHPIVAADWCSSMENATPCLLRAIEIRCISTLIVGSTTRTAGAAAGAISIGWSA